MTLNQTKKHANVAPDAMGSVRLGAETPGTSSSNDGGQARIWDVDPGIVYCTGGPQFPPEHLQKPGRVAQSSKDSDRAAQLKKFLLDRIGDRHKNNEFNADEATTSSPSPSAPASPSPRRRLPVRFTRKQPNAVSPSASPPAGIPTDDEEQAAQTFLDELQRQITQNHLEDQAPQSALEAQFGINRSNNTTPTNQPLLNMAHQNGMNGPNGAGNMQGGIGQMMGGGNNAPFPAGHQQDLNSIMRQVEQLSAELERTRQESAHVIEAAGRFRQIAMERNMTQDQIIENFGKELEETSANIEKQNSDLRRELANTTHDKEEYAKLCHEFATQMGQQLEMLHAFKLKTSLDMAAWHKSYRDQLAAEREENMKLRCTIFDMQASAARGAEFLRNFRRNWDRSDLFYEQQAEITKYRQMARFYKRMAFSELPSDDSEFSDDSDLVDPEEKKRLARVEEEKKLRAEESARMAGVGMGGDESDEAAAALAAVMAGTTLEDPIEVGEEAGGRVSLGM